MNDFKEGYGIKSYDHGGFYEVIYSNYRENGKKIKKMEKEKLNGLMEQFMM